MPRVLPVALLWLAASAIAAESSAGVIRRIEITGLKRTKPQVVLQYMDIREGDAADKIDASFGMS